MRRAKPASWYDDLRTRGRFERGFRAEYPNATVVPGWRGSDAVYKSNVTIPEFENRELEIIVPGGQVKPIVVDVLSDFPAKLKHSYGVRSGTRDSRERLCIWYPSDPTARTWSWEDGVAALFGLARIHLYREAHFLEHQLWLGPEAPHEKPDADVD